MIYVHSDEHACMTCRRACMTSKRFACCINESDIPVKHSFQPNIMSNENFLRKTWQNVALRFKIWHFKQREQISETTCSSSQITFWKLSTLAGINHSWCICRYPITPHSLIDFNILLNCHAVFPGFANVWLTAHPLVDFTRHVIIFIWHHHIHRHITGLRLWPMQLISFFSYHQFPASQTHWNWNLKFILQHKSIMIYIGSVKNAKRKYK